MLIYPLLYKNYGVITVQVSLTFLTYLCYKTCNLIILHTKNSEDDFNQVVLRHLSPTYHKVFCLAGSLNSFTLCTAYFMFFINIAYK